MGDRTKLPKWAQQEFETLEMRLAERDERLRAAVSGDGSSHFTQKVSAMTEDLPLIGDRLTVTMNEKHAAIRVAEDANGREYLEVMCIEAAVLVQPQSTNVVRVYLERRY